MLDHRTSQLTGLLLPLADRHLVLPNVAIAELIDFQRGEPASDAPPWYLRQVTWRDQQLPLINMLTDTALSRASPLPHFELHRV
jgi:chemosensory pili system protein ChpC